MDAFLQNVGASSAAALTARLISHPFDTVKTRVQADPTVRSSKFSVVFRAVFQSEGMAGLYRGLPVSLAFSMPAVSTYLYVYDATKAAIGATPAVSFTVNSPMTHLMSAVVAEMISGLFWTPLELIKNKQQVSAQAHLSSSSSSLPMFATPSSSSSSIPRSSTLDSVNQPLIHPHKRKLSTDSTGSRGGGGGGQGTRSPGRVVARMDPQAAANLRRSISYSAASLASQGSMSMRGSSTLSGAVPAGGGDAQSVKAIARKIYQREGLIGFFKGYWLSLTVFIPYSIAYFVAYEQLKSTWLSTFPPPQLSAPTSPIESTSTSTTATPTAPPLPLYGYLLCAAVSGALAAAVSNPLDRVKTIVQVSDRRLRDRDMRLASVIARLAKEEGWWQAAMRGVGSRCMWAVPNVVVSMVVYEALKVHG
ncbi:mitochondrial carrier domain-containing protein [Catenaria anguillulae PL171]|uniref:Mitochondrial carrier domain-containing protein n=1 Tax=Catenaria anguillulae PL171 TaxID=765915 RepID=A0A1Y2HI83_9FUNG|nr:mitochondrial carrier domain-containing protein [Catenaria anguillulae PL171]